MGSAQAVDEAIAMIANAAEASIRRCRLRIRGILGDSLYFSSQAVEEKVRMAGGFQGVFLAQAQRRSLWLSLRLCAFAGKYSPDPADDRLGLSYSKQELDDEIA